MIEGKLEPEDALTQACDLLSAGLDTVSTNVLCSCINIILAIQTKNTSTFMLFELAKQPALQDQLFQEIKAVLGDKVNPSWEDLQNIPLVRHCLKETLRLYPALQVIARELEEDTVIEGYHVPAGVRNHNAVCLTVMCNYYALDSSIIRHIYFRLQCFQHMG